MAPTPFQRMRAASLQGGRDSGVPIVGRAAGKMGPTYPLGAWRPGQGWRQEPLRAPPPSVAHAVLASGSHGNRGPHQTVGGGDTESLHLV